MSKLKRDTQTIPPAVVGPKRILRWFLLLATMLVLIHGAWLFLRGRDVGTQTRSSRHTLSTPTEDDASVNLQDRQMRVDDRVPAPGLDNQRYITPLADAYRRIDPGEDGWETESFNEAANQQLKLLEKLFLHHARIDGQKLQVLAGDNFACYALQPVSLDEVFRDGVLRVQRASDSGALTPSGKTFRGPAGLGEAIKQFCAVFANGNVQRIKLKPFRIMPQDDGVVSRAYFQAVGDGGPGRLQINAKWTLRWSTMAANTKPTLTTIHVEEYETVLHRGSNATMFSDCTESVLRDTEGYREQFLYPTDYWRARLPRDLGLDVVANHGIAIGDVNGDQLDDLYVCQQGGLPNRLLVQNSDGTLRDITAECGADWLDYCASALIVDFDNDGDRDLAVAQEWRILLMSNDGKGRFQLEFGISSKAQAFSISAADFDLDGDVDLYVCGYNPTASTLRRGAMGEPMPYHDANNGGQNVLLRNDGNWLFTDVTADVGLDQNNSRFSFAAAWEDYDNDGDSDLYVANDYGRNNLYRNDGGRFVDEARQLNVEDMSAGMSASWADFNRDGWMDLYVSNMFSAAGNRITYQRQFKSAADTSVRQQFQRHARGNTLFANTGKGGFRDVSEEASVTMGRWAWGSKFADLNGDGWEDLVVANGFITAQDTGDL